MLECVGCRKYTVDPREPARYDVLHPEYDPATAKPYCEGCFADTLSGGDSSEIQSD